MDIQTKEALITEIEKFKTESLKTHIVQVWAESYTNTDPFGYVILEKEDSKVWFMKTQAYQLWQMWQAAKAQAVPYGSCSIKPHEVTINETKNELIDGYDIAKEDEYLLESLVYRGFCIGKAQAVPEGYVMVPKEKITHFWQDDDEPENFCTHESNFDSLGDCVDDGEVMVISKFTQANISQQRMFGV